MTLHVTPIMYLIVLPMAFFAAAVDAIAGGGGLISLPAYTLAGLDYDLASGSNKLSATFGAIVATVRYAKSGRIMLWPAFWAALFAAPGSVVGTRLAIALGTRTMTAIMVFAVPVMGLLVAFRGNGPETSRPVTRKAYPVCAMIGLVIGCYDGFFGPGTGTLLIMAFTCFLGMDPVGASATAKPVNLLSNIASLIVRIASGNVLYALAVPAMLCAALGSRMGAKLAITRGAGMVRGVMLFVLALLTIKLAVGLLT